MRSIARAFNTKRFFTIFTLAMLAPVSAFAANMDAQIKECQKLSSAQNKNGFMPKGVTDENIRDYKQAYRCEKSQGRDEGACKDVMKKLEQAATEINRMVKQGCEKYIPQMAQIKGCSDANAQTTCTADASKALDQLNSEIRTFKQKLANFRNLMEEAKKQGMETSEKVRDVAQESEGSRGTPAYDQPGSGAQRIGLGTPSQADAFNAGQSAAQAAQIISDFKSKFGSDSGGSGISSSDFASRSQNLEQAWQQVEQVQSKMLKENLQAYLNAEEVKLAAQKYDGQLQELQKQTETMASANSQTQEKLGAVPGGGMPQAPSGGAGGGEGEGSSGITDDPSGPYSSVASSKKNNNLLGDTDANGAKVGTKVGIDDKNPEVAAGEEGKNTSGASRSPASGSLRDSLRKKLAAGGGSGGSTGASVGGSAGGSGEGGKASDKTAAAAEGKAGAHGEGGVLGAGGGDGLLGSFEKGELEEGAFEVAGSDTDASVKGILSEFEGSLGDTADLQGADIGETDGPSLFSRVKDFHGRCLKRGCVVGTAPKGHI